MINATEYWLDTSRALIQTLIPKEFADSLPDMNAATHADIVDREFGRVDVALFAMAAAEDEAEVKEIVSGLKRETIIALCSRWAHYHKEWLRLERASAAPLWVPTDGRGLWRVIFLALADDKAAASALLCRLFPEAPGVVHG